MESFLSEIFQQNHAIAHCSSLFFLPLRRRLASQTSWDWHFSAFALCHPSWGAVVLQDPLLEHGMRRRAAATEQLSVMRDHSTKYDDTTNVTGLESGMNCECCADHASRFRAEMLPNRSECNEQSRKSDLILFSKFELMFELFS